MKSHFFFKPLQSCLTLDIQQTHSYYVTSIHPFVCLELHLHKHATHSSRKYSWPGHEKYNSNNKCNKKAHYPSAEFLIIKRIRS